jgi:hypothetical protein
MSNDLAPAEVASYQRFAEDLTAQVQTYRSAVSTMRSTPDCTLARQQYLDGVRPDVAGMGPLARHIEDHMMSMGTKHGGDMQCGMDLISREVDRHAGVACASGSLETNRAEALRHCDQMQQYSEHMRMRGVEAAGMMGSQMMGSGMMGCCSGQTDGGWMMPDGGMMPWDHQVPGCSQDGG